MSLDDVPLLPNAVNIGDPDHVDHHVVIHSALKEIKTLAEGVETGVVKTSGNQTIAGVKTFSQSPVVPSPSVAGDAVNKGYLDGQLDTKEDSLGVGNSSQYLRGDRTWQTLDSQAVGLGNVDNTSDLDKPISTAVQSALNTKADDSDVVKLTGNQTISGEKTFSTAPKFGSGTIGQVWTATSVNGEGAWADLSEDAGDVEWGSILNKPTSFPPIVGSGSNQAAPGDHTHTKSDIGLGNVDNTSDLDKPISTATQSALDGKVSTSRAINTSGALSGGGNLGSDRTISLASGGVQVSHLHESVRTEPIFYMQTGATRAVGLGELTDGIRIPYDMNIVSVRYRMGTADGGGTTTVELRKNGSTVSGSSGTASVSPSEVSGTWAFSAGDILTVYITAIGSTPGKRLTADIIGVRTA